MSEKNDSQQDAWESMYTRAGMLVVSRKEYAERKEQLQTDAYADGRADEREGWKPLLAALEEALEYLEDCSDVSDGPNGEPMPNRAMQLVDPIREAIYKATGERP